MQDIIKLLIAMGILLFGFVLMRLASRILIKIRRRAIKEKSISNKPLTSIFEKVFFAIILIIALFFLGFRSVDDFTLRVIKSVPQIILLILLVVLGVLFVQIISWILERFLFYMRLEEIISDDISLNLVPMISVTVKFILFIVFFQFLLNITNIPAIERIANVIFYPLLILIFGLLFVAFMSPAKNLAAGFQLRNFTNFKNGCKIRYEGRNFTVKRMYLISCELETTNGDSVFIPNSVIGNKAVEVQKPPKEIATLEQIKNRFVAQLPSMCGPASAQIALSIFGFYTEQTKIAKASKTIVRKSSDQVAGTHPKTLIKAIEKTTDNQVIGAWVDFDKITNLKIEINTWLKEGGLIIVDYKKRYLFPTALRAHYSLAVGIRGDEILIVDPSGLSGGVYFVDYRDVEIGMDTVSELIKGKRGYIILAPEGTSAFKRIKEGLIYSDPSKYNKLTRNIERRLNKITSPAVLTDLLPDFVKKHVKKLEKEQVSRVWKP